MAKGNIFILSGQSNMSGRGGVKNRQWDGVLPEACRPNPSILRLSGAGAWEPAREPLHFDIDVSKTCGIGPGMPFANFLRPQIPQDSDIGLVPCAEGGTAIIEWERGSRLYSQMVRRAKEAVSSSAAAEIKAVIWFQGESDTLSDEDAGAYRGRMEKLIGDLRSDLGLPSLPFIQVAIASGDEGRVETVREAQLGFDLDGVACVDAKGLPLNEDGLHLSTAAQVALGRLLAETYEKRFLPAIIQGRFD
ncbi:putative carbohydrate esterase [Apostasia shenzhenica]|uniref:Putative carbohydrate esterase n=1 Tax=Apostasia shenzhenica TaxID=1088818 RepID=A0A2I0A7G0_9ASPA|nr:putative carbohydrate esterase [Apostasia shenzhenica]